MSSRPTTKGRTTIPTKNTISLENDGETGTISAVQFRSRVVHRQLASVDETQRPRLLLDILDVGSEILSRVDRHGDLENLAKAVEKLDQEAKRIVMSAAEHVDRCIEKAVSDMTISIQGDNGPLKPLLQRFDPGVEGNVIDLFRDLVASTAAKATKRAVEELAESTEESMERLASSLAALEKVAAVEEARLAEAQRGTAKGFDHERDAESLLGELVTVGSDSLDDVSTVPGLAGTKRGDKTITPRGGCTIVTEEKCASRMSESKIRALLSEAMANRGADLAMLIVDDEAKVPGNQPFHLIDDDKVVVVAERLPLRMVYALFRAKALELAKSTCTAGNLEVAETLITVRRLVEDIKRALERFRLLRTEHTKASKAITQAGRYVDETEEAIADCVTEIMTVIDSLVDEDGEVAA